jgi:two-component system chemotaxis sensor kinase CheA
MDELLEQFLIEGRELVQQASEDLLALDRDHGDTARLDSAFRAVHTLKGSVGLFDLAPMGHALHAAEDLLSAVRDGRLALDRGIIGTLLDCVGASEEWLDGIGQAGQLPPGAEQRGRDLQTKLSARLGQAHAAAIPASGTGEWLTALQLRARTAIAEARSAGHGLTALRYVPAADCFLNGDDPLAVIGSIPGLVAVFVAAREPWSIAPVEPFTCNLVIEALSTAAMDEVAGVLRFVSDQVEIADLAASAVAAPPPVSRVLRVDAGRIDALMDLVGELIVAKNALAHLATRAAALDMELGRALTVNQGDIERLAGEMHRAVMGVRMIPLAQTFRRFPRLVRELAAKVGKEVEFEVTGEELEADKSIVDALYEPLLHVLRNAIDHGIEALPDRIAAGKPAVARLTLAANWISNQLVVSVCDDGPGLDLAKIREVARQRGVAGAAGALDDAAAAELIFAPGFSTAAVVTDVSGRGVGMDAVRSAIAALGGRVALSSEPGAGTTLRLVLPPTVTIHKIITVQVGEDRFGIPIAALVETARVPASHIRPVGGAEAFVLRDRTIPLLRLATLLDRPAGPRPAAAKILIVATAEGPVGVEVDDLAERVDVLLRPLTGLLSGMAGVLGAALLGDGSVLTVLDMLELIG